MSSTDAAQLGINPFVRNVRLLLPAGFGRIGHGCRTRLSNQAGGRPIHRHLYSAARSLTTSRRHSVFNWFFYTWSITRTSTGAFYPICSWIASKIEASSIVAIQGPWFVSGVRRSLKLKTPFLVKDFSARYARGR
jgi:hypothetical protein